MTDWMLRNCPDCKQLKAKIYKVARVVNPRGADTSEIDAITDKLKKAQADPDYQLAMIRYKEHMKAFHGVEL